jgi:hypothetical protein
MKYFQLRSCRQCTWRSVGVLEGNPVNLSMAKKKKTSSMDVAKNLQRKLAIAQGFYDGRFRPKRVKDKRKEESRKLARKKINARDVAE